MEDLYIMDKIIRVIIGQEDFYRKVEIGILV